MIVVRLEEAIVFGLTPESTLELVSHSCRDWLVAPRVASPSEQDVNVLMNVINQVGVPK